MTTIILERPLNLQECFGLAERTDLLYRKLKNVGLARKYAESLLNDSHTALDVAAAKVIKLSPPHMHPVKFINKRNLAVLRVVSASTKRATIIGIDGRVYRANRGHIFPDGKFIPTARRLPMGFALYTTGAKSDFSKLKRVVTLKPSLPYIQ